ncbi:MAG: sugar transferase [Puniceicoccaceae bacterium]
MYRRFGKRVFDAASAGVLLVLLAPALALIALAVARALGRPVFFKQVRPGRNGVLFSIVKFRTMREATDERGEPLPDEERLGRFGALLRSTSLDELPELWNVLRGEMSLVGPRPLLPRYVDRYTPRQARRMEVRPGITGWAQINGRNALDWETRFEMDVWYVENVSFALDLRILVRTVGKILRREGIAAEGRATVEEFRGSAPGGPEKGG